MSTRTNYLRPLVLLVLAALAAGVMMAVVLASPAWAKNYTVNSTADPGDGQCTTNLGGCTLREAINAANTNSAADKITFAQSVSGQPITFSPGSGELVISDPKGLTIDGGSADITVSGGHEDLVRVFRVDPAAKLTLNNLTVADGTVDDIGGGILNHGTLTVSNSTIADNQALASNQAPGSGGSITNGGRLTVSNSTFFGNTAFIGGGIYDFGTVTEVSNSTLSGNSATNGQPQTGGGIDIDFDLTMPTVKNTIVANNAGGDCHPSSVPTDGGYNLDSDGSCSFSEANNSLPAVAPSQLKLGPLADNGGPTETMALDNGSLAIDKGKSFGAKTDQRGERRPIDFPNTPNATDGNGSDIGAYEVQQ